MSVKLIPKNQKGGMVKKTSEGKSKVKEAIDLAKVKKNENGSKIEVVKKRPPLAEPKPMTNVQRFRNDPTEFPKGTSKENLAEVDKRNAEVVAGEKKDKELRGYQERQKLRARKERGY